jgi:hypothetical protein
MVSCCPLYISFSVLNSGGYTESGRTRCTVLGSYVGDDLLEFESLKHLHRLLRHGKMMSQSAAPNYGHGTKGIASIAEPDG